MKLQKLLMKSKVTVLLATFLVTMGLLLGTSAAQAFTVLVDSSGTNAYAILDLPVLNLETQETINYDVTFRLEPGEDVYPETSDGFDFDFFDETVFSAIQAVVDALNDTPLVTTVGPEDEGGQSSFRIGVTKVAIYGWIVSVTGKYLSGDSTTGWAREGVAVNNPRENAMYADFTER